MSGEIPLDAIRHNLDLLRKAMSSTFLLDIAHAEALVRLAEAGVRRENAMMSVTATEGGAEYEEAWDNYRAALSPFLPGKEGA